MKVILSRKGFDSAAGGIPSPILGKQLISIPIPRAYTGYDYRELTFQHQKETFSYAKLLSDLGVHFFSEYHLDPDLQKEIKQRHHPWRPAFSQSGAAAAELSTVSINDLFLFFGNFRAAEFKNGTFSFVKQSQEIHLIWGYLKVQEIYDKQKILAHNIPLELRDRPHYYHADFKNDKHTFIFASDEKNSGVFEFKQDLILSKTEQAPYRKSHWKALPFLEPSSNRIKKLDEDTWNSGGRGQEFICRISKPKQFEEWFNQLQNPPKV